MVAHGEFCTIVEENNYKNYVESIDTKLTPIQKFYTGVNVLVTGSTGFLGKTLVEKLLRSCPTVSSLYLVIRSKKGKCMEERLDELFDDVLFSRLKKECPKFRHKVIGIEGDCALPELGLDMQDKRLLVDEISVIFHVAATVRFDEKLKTAAAINVRSVRDLLKLSKEMVNLKAFMYVSTLYANCPELTIEEKIYQSPIDGDKLILMAENLPDNVLNDVTNALLGKYPNTYTFTKQISENVISKTGQNLPVGIFRPAIVVSTYKEPIEAWISNLYGPTGVCAGAGTGVLRTLHCDPHANANLVPVDMCVNSLIASAWEVGDMYQKALQQKSSFEIPVYNYESSNDNPIDWGTFMYLSQKSGLKTPTSKAIWYYFFGLYKNYYHYLVATFLFHTMPAIVADVVMFCMGKTPQMSKVYKKIHKFSDVISYFATRSWKIQSARVHQLISKMSGEDQDLFFCDLRKLDWNEFYLSYLRGVRVYLLKDPMDTLPQARKRWSRLYAAHQVTKALVFLLLLRLAWMLLRMMV
ncbi:fatty acyl-CoA reductase wat-like [Cylas formicarius]|uniref:fatty acyl-CoA reductase wat-like n=1 Tax=Cylas formicarius TaxID=197179 RepID=UPI00295870D3|nr:fatty acyl-CoA reductase wat-like [Cylas formicarius]